MRLFNALAVVVTLSFLFNCENERLCGDVAPNSTINRIGYCAAESTLSIAFVNDLSYCTGELPYRTNRLDISLNNFKGTYQNRKAENPDIFQFQKDTEILFNGEIRCYDTCVIPIPIRLPNIEIRYIKDRSENIKFEIDTNGQFAGQYNICGYE